MSTGWGFRSSIMMSFAFSLVNQWPSYCFLSKWQRKIKMLLGKCSTSCTGYPKAIFTCCSNCRLPHTMFSWDYSSCLLWRIPRLVYHQVQDVHLHPHYLNLKDSAELADSMPSFPQAQPVPRISGVHPEIFNHDKNYSPMRCIEVLLKIVNGLRIIAERSCREVAENVKLITGKCKILIIILLTKRLAIIIHKLSYPECLQHPHLAIMLSWEKVFQGFKTIKEWGKHSVSSAENKISNKILLMIWYLK